MRGVYEREGTSFQESLRKLKFSLLHVLHMLASGKLLPNPRCQMYSGNLRQYNTHRSTIVDWHIEHEILNYLTHQGNKYKNVLTFEFTSAQDQ